MSDGKPKLSIHAPTVMTDLNADQPNHAADCNPGAFNHHVTLTMVLLSSPTLISMSVSGPRMSNVVRGGNSERHHAVDHIGCD